MPILHLIEAGLYRFGEGVKGFHGGVFDPKLAVHLVDYERGVANRLYAFDANEGAEVEAEDEGGVFREVVGDFGAQVVGPGEEEGLGVGRLDDDAGAALVSLRGRGWARPFRRSRIGR